MPLPFWVDIANVRLKKLLEVFEAGNFCSTAPSQYLTSVVLKKGTLASVCHGTLAALGEEWGSGRVSARAGATFKVPELVLAADAPRNETRAFRVP